MRVVVASVLIVVPASVAVFLLSGLFEARDSSHRPGRDALFSRLDTPIDVAAELGDAADPTAQVFQFLSRATALVAVAESVDAAGDAGRTSGRAVLAYVAMTLAVAGGLALVRGSRSRSRRPRTVPHEVKSAAGLLPSGSFRCERLRAAAGVLRRPRFRCVGRGLLSGAGLLRSSAARGRLVASAEERAGIEAEPQRA